MKIKDQQIWKNCIGNVVSHVYKIYLPESLEDLVFIARKAEEDGVRVRAVGSGHSFSEVTKTNGYLVNPVLLNRPVNDFRKALLSGQPDTLVELQAGMTIKAMNEHLDSMGLSVVNMGGVNVQKVAGAVSTATHGSGLGLPSFPGMVRSFVMVSGEGKVYRIEPADRPLSDPARFAKENPGVILLQDNDAFYSALVAFGCMGMIYSIVFEMRKQYYLAELRFLEKWSTVKAWIGSGHIFTQDYTKSIKEKSREKLKDYWTTGVNENRSVMVRINPYRVGDDHTCLVIVHREIKELPPRSPGEITRNPGLGALSVVAGDVVAWLGRRVFNRRPEQTPEMIERSLKQEVDNIYVANAHESLFLGLVNIKEHGYDTEFAFDQSDPARYLEAIDVFMGFARVRAEKGIYQTGQIGLRWVKQGRHYLAPEFGRDVCYVDISCLEGTFGAEEVLDEAQALLLLRGGWPHWGKLNNVLEGRPELIAQYFSKLPQWKSVASRLDPRGIFKNRFSDMHQLRRSD